MEGKLYRVRSRIGIESWPFWWNGRGCETEFFLSFFIFLFFYFVEYGWDATTELRWWSSFQDQVSHISNYQHIIVLLVNYNFLVIVCDF